MPRTKETSVDLGDATLNLRYDFNAICNVEDLTGKNLLLPGALEGVTGSIVRSLVYGCHLAYHQFRDESPKHNLYGIGALIDGDSAEKLMVAIKELAGEEEDGETAGADPTEVTAVED